MIGDPTIYGWLTVAAYALAAWLCVRASRSGPNGERRLWLVFAAMMAFLCINKELDLQTLLTAAGRSFALEHGWYEQRRRYQAEFIVLFAIGALLAIAVLIRSFRRAQWAVKGAIVGVAILTLFVIVRASSFEKMDQFINSHVRGWKMNHMMEFGGIAIVALCAWAAQRRVPARRARRRR